MEGSAIRELDGWFGDPLFGFSLMADTQHLTALDDLWTSLLATPDIRSSLQPNLPLLQRMVGELVGSLTSVTARTYPLERFVDTAPEFGIDLDRLLSDILAQSEVRAEGPQRFRDAVREACRTLREETPAEIAAITAKLMRIAEGHYEPGDWSLKVKKALLIVAAAAGLVVAISIPGALAIPVAISVGAGVVSVVSSALLAWDSLPAT